MILLMGPTAAGKTDVAVELVQRYPMDIVSVDSAMIYRGMDIGTAKPDAQTLRQAPHRLIDILDPADAYSAARFREDALTAITDIHARGRIPLLVGGTMLYFRVLQQGIAPMPAADAGIRERLAAEAAEHGWEHLHDRLRSIDPEAAARIHPNDPQRLQRALEVYELSGQTLSALHRQGVHGAERFSWLKLAIAPQDRQWLHERIARRFDQMLEQGFLDEVRGFYQRGDLNVELPSMRSVGYRQAWNHLAGEYDANELRLKGVAATRQLAKRQFTWLRSDAGVQFIEPEPDALEKTLAAVNRFGV